MRVFFIIMYLMLTTLGVVLMKKGGNPGSIAMTNSTFNFQINLISAIGLLCYIFSFVLYTRIIVSYDLSYIVPIVTGIVQLLTLISAAVIFKEKFYWNSIVGSAAIIFGLILMNIKLK